MNKHFVCTPFAVAMILVLPLLMLSAQSGDPAKTFTGEVMDSICAPNGSHAAVMGKMPNMGSDGETCTKKCVAMGAKYMVYDPAAHSAYSVDDENKLAEFAGRKVRVTGTFVGSMIRVVSVHELS